jgi:hypothetical protein
MPELEVAQADSEMEVQRGYLSALRLATAKPDAEDRPGEIVSHARRKRGGARIRPRQAFERQQVGKNAFDFRSWHFSDIPQSPRFGR